MCVCACVCVYVCVSAYVCVFVCVCVYTHARAHTRACAHTRTRAAYEAVGIASDLCIHIYMYVYTHTHTHTRSRARALARAHTHECVCVCARARACAHCACTYIPPLLTRMLGSPGLKATSVTEGPCLRVWMAAPVTASQSLTVWSMLQDTMPTHSDKSAPCQMYCTKAEKEDV